MMSGHETPTSTLTRAEAEQRVNELDRRENDAKHALAAATQAVAVAVGELERARVRAASFEGGATISDLSMLNPTQLARRSAEVTEAQSGVQRAQAQVERLTRERDAIRREAQAPRAALATILDAEVAAADTKIDTILAEARVARDVVRSAQQRLRPLLEQAHHDEERAARLRGETPARILWSELPRWRAASDITALKV